MAYFEGSSVSSAPYKGQNASTSEESIMKNINLYRGMVTSNFQLVNLAGMDGLDISLGVSYNPKENLALNANQRSCNSVVGTGMEIALSAIIVRNRSVRETYQSEYYIAGEGGEFPLYRCDKAVDFIEFMSFEHPFWKYKKYEKHWEVVRDDGSVWIYGETEDSKENNICWGNWTGPCNCYGGEVYTVGWYLSSVVSRYGNHIHFEYENIQLRIGDCNYTSELYLKNIVSTFGQRVCINYLPKDEKEYKLPHNAECGAYQFLCVRHYLDSIDVYSDENILLYSQKLTYDLISGAEGEIKRYLTKINQITQDGEAMPPLVIHWNYSEAIFNQICSISYPHGATLEFEYGVQKVANYQTSAFLECNEEWKQIIKSGTDFTAILSYREEADQAQIKLLSWDMSWQIYEDKDFNQIAVKNASLFLGNGLVVIRYLSPIENNYMLRIMKRVPVKRYDWESFDVRLDSKDCPSVACGSDFVAIQYPNINELLVYQFNYIDNTWKKYVLPVDTMEHQVIGAGNGCVFGAYGNTNSQTVRLVTFYCDEKHEWKKGDAVDIPASVTWNYEASLPVWSINGSIATACFVADAGDDLEATMVAIAWDFEYVITNKQILKVKQKKTSGNPIYYSIATDTMLGFGNTALRYTPNGYIEKKLININYECEYAYAYGSDLFVGVEKQPDGYQRFFVSRFNPVIGEWTDEGVPYVEGMMNFEKLLRPLITSDYAVIGNAIFVRNTDDRWSLLGNIPEEADYSTVRIDQSGRYVLYSIPHESSTRFVPLLSKTLGKPVTLQDALIIESSNYEAGNSSFFLKSIPTEYSGTKFYNIYRNQYYLDAPDISFVNKVILDTGLEKQAVFFEYDNSSIRLEEAGFAVGTASVLPVCADGSYGKTVYSYYNGAAPSRVSYPSSDNYNNVADFYTHFAGMVYYTAYYNGDGEKISESHCNMKAFDTHGFCIQQTRLKKTDYLKRFNMNMQSSNEICDEINSVIEFEYEPKYYRKNKIINKSFDKDGKEILKVQSIKYAFEEIPQMEAANLINDVLQSTNESIHDDLIIDMSKYEYDMNQNGYYYQTAENVMGRTEGEWLQVSKVIEVNQQCNTLCEVNERNHPISTLYDISGRYPVAVTEYALPSEVLYCGFEPYETTQGLSIEGETLHPYYTKEKCFSGTQCLLLSKGRSLSASVNVRDNGLKLYINISSKSEVAVTVDFNNGEIVHKSLAVQNQWLSYREIFQSIEHTEAAIVTIMGSDDVYIDTCYISPVMAQGEAHVYTGKLMLQTAIHNNNKQGLFSYFDQYESPCINTSDDGIFFSITNTIFHDNGEPNEMYTVKLSSESIWYDSRIGYRESLLFHQDKTDWVFAQESNFALVFSAEQLYGASMPSVQVGQTSITCSDNEWRLLNGTEIQTANIPKGKFYMLIKVGNRCGFYGDGVQLFQFLISEKEVKPSLKNAANIKYFGFIPNPIICFSYADYTGRVLQDQVVSENGIRIVHTIYNKLGVKAARTALTEIPNEFWGYRKDFVTNYQQETGKTEGEICKYYPEAEEYPCISYKTTLCSQPEVTELAQSGKQFAFGSGFTVKHATCTMGEFSEFAKDGFCAGDFTTDPDGMITFNLKDGRGLVMSGKLSAERTMCEMTAYELDARGNTTKIYYPKYFCDSPEAKSYISSIEYDSLGNIAKRKDPDTEEVLTAYDRYGNLRFIRQEDTKEQYIYHLYDKYGRKTEIGYVPEGWDDEKLRKMVDEENERPEKGVPVKQFFYDVGIEGVRTINQVDKLIRVVTIVEQEMVEEQYDYDFYGRQTRYAIFMEGRTEECYVKYDAAGNVVERSTGNSTDGILNYIYNMNGELTGIKYNNEDIYGCGYSTNGNLSFETFGKSIKRNYTYNTASYLTEIRGTFFEQIISYAQENADNQKKSGQISSVYTNYNFDENSDFPKESTLNASYDSLGRIVQVITDEDKIINYSYDMNGNQLIPAISYVEGTDRIDKFQEAEIMYEGFGAVKKHEKRYEFEYEPVTQLVKNLRSADKQTHYKIGTGICGFVTEDGLTVAVSTEDGKLFFERGDDKKAKILVYGANGVFAQIVDGKVYYLLKDYRSSVCGVADDKGMLAAYQYDLFGKVTQAWERKDEISELIPLRFSGARYETIGLYRFKFRFYDPLLGRFLSVDPMVQYANPYLYGGCDWINYFDPDGAFNVGGFAASLCAGILLTVAGVAITVATAGMGGALGVGLSIAAAGIIGAGISSTIYSITSAINDDFSLGAWGIQLGFGAVFGMISAGIGAMASSTMSVSASVIYDGVSGMLVGAADGVVTNGVLNTYNGKAFCDNIVTNCVTGACLGGIMGAVTGMSTAARNAKSMIRRGGSQVQQLGTANYVEGICGRHSKVGVRMGNTGDSDAGSHLGYLITADGRYNEKKAALFTTGLYESDPKTRWINVKNPVGDRARNAMNVTFNTPYGDYSKIFNSCTGYVINVSTKAGIYQPLWARSPWTMDLWVRLSAAFQS